MIPLPNKTKVIKGKDKNFATFEIEGLYPGYGVTIGNALRRVLLSSLEGAAAIKVKIKGVQHEFATINGVLEDVITICQNLKLLRFKIHTSEPQKATLRVKGEKEVKGEDFELPSQVELTNPKVHIATLTSKTSSLEMEIQIEPGIGYVQAEHREKEKLAIGEIQLDAIFTPVKKVSFKAEDMRVGDRTDFNKIKIDVETDGTVIPEEAFCRAADILVEHFSLASEGLEREVRKEVSDKVSTDIRIEDLKLSGRTASALTQNNIKSIGVLLKKREGALLNMKGLGDKGVKEIKKALKKLNLELKQ